MIFNEGLNFIDVVNVMDYLLQIDSISKNTKDLAEIHQHLHEQDEKLNRIISLLEDMKNA